MKKVSFWTICITLLFAFRCETRVLNIYQLNQREVFYLQPSIDSPAITAIKYWAQGVPIIAMVEIIKVRPYYKGERIESEVTLKVEDYLWNSGLQPTRGETFYLTMPGGEIDGKITVSSEAPILHIHDKGIIALEEGFTIAKRNKSFIPIINEQVSLCINYSRRSDLKSPPTTYYFINVPGLPENTLSQINLTTLKKAFQ